jgi:hypothetical protein
VNKDSGDSNLDEIRKQDGLETVNASFSHRLPQHLENPRKMLGKPRES